MELSKTVVLSGVVGGLFAVGLIVATIFAFPGIGTPLVSISTQTTTVSNSASVDTGPSGTLSALITDPPTVPSGTTDVYMSYTSIEVHESGESNSSLYWYTIGTGGTIDLMDSINVSQTIGLASVPSGISYDEIGFNISSVVVTFDAVNYSASLLDGTRSLYENIPGQVSVSATQTQAILIDMSPKILLLGSSSAPAFAFLPSAKAYVIPTSDIPAQAHTLGARSNLRDNGWWDSIPLTQFEITSLSLSPNFLAINVTNTGNTSVTFKLATVTPSSNSTYGPSVPPLESSAAFAITANATLVPLQGSNRSAIVSEVSNDGYVLSPHATVTLAFTDPIIIGLIQFAEASATTSSIVLTQPYIVKLFGNDNVAYTLITG